MAPPQPVVAREATHHYESQGIVFCNIRSFLYAYELKVACHQSEFKQEKPKRETPSTGDHLQL